MKTSNVSASLESLGLLALSFGLACRNSSPEASRPKSAVGVESAPSPSEAPKDSDNASLPAGADTPDELPWQERETRRAKAAEARVGLARLLDAADAIHDTESICHLWPEGRIGPVPPLDTRCEDAPDRACVVVDPPDKPDAAWEYSASAWDTPEWRALGYRRFDSHYYRYSVEWHFEGEGDERQCATLVTVVGDLDGDGVLGKFQRRSPPFSGGEHGKVEHVRIVNELE